VPEVYHQITVAGLLMAMELWAEYCKSGHHRPPGGPKCSL